MKPDPDFSIILYGLTLFSTGFIIVLTLIFAL